ncbi:hypothetical protein COLO4_04382 [Corchorus olitorius]|uniref:Prolamin-like domain-containing protein n=1 Tax=Corchorus olitorius TaxID=93759 RepID=A0A1R3KUC1_9ROSI|nr:hypothetical protein COLO4_08207 [Corchorus olitorius]OMP10638.1 hypothetical protein COLO4_04382 [Corchorus olitorius]
MALPCAREVFTSIFKTGAVTKKFCGQLKQLGKVCNDAFVKKTLEDPIYKNLSESAIAKKSRKTWNTCASVIDISPSSSA